MHARRRTRHAQVHGHERRVAHVSAWACRATVGWVRSVFADTPRLLIVMNPRRIPEAMYSFRNLARVTVCYIRGRTETELVSTIPTILKEWQGTDAMQGRRGLVGLISDDTIVGQRALDTTFDQCADIDGMPTSGWCSLDLTSPIASLCRNELSDPRPRDTSYVMERVDWVRAQTHPIRASFTGLALHVMDTDWWDEYPFGVYGDDAHGWASDYHLARRLNKDDVPIMVDPTAEILHLKEVWQKADRHPSKQLYLGRRHHAIEWQRA